MAVFGPPLGIIACYWARLRWSLARLRELWQLPEGQRDTAVEALSAIRDGRPLAQPSIVRVVEVVERPQPPRPISKIKPSAVRAWWKWGQRLRTLTREQTAVVDRVLVALESPYWPAVRDHVRACATTPSFHDPKQWIGYSRALRANPGQAQNLYRHLKVVADLQAAHPGVPNPQAHLLAELGYQGFAVEGRPRRLVSHPVLHRVS